MSSQVILLCGICVHFLLYYNVMHIITTRRRTNGIKFNKTLVSAFSKRRNRVYAKKNDCERTIKNPFSSFRFKILY